MLRVNTHTYQLVICLDCFTVIACSLSQLGQPLPHRQAVWCNVLCSCVCLLCSGKVVQVKRSISTRPVCGDKVVCMCAPGIHMPLQTRTAVLRSWWDLYPQPVWLLSALQHSPAGRWLLQQRLGRPAG